MAPKKKTQRDWTELSVKVLQERAQEAGMLGAEERLVFEPGSVSNGVSPNITAYSEFGRSRTQPYWLPIFTTKDTARTVERICDAQARLLYSLNLQRAFNRTIGQD